MEKHPIESLMNTAMSNLKEMIDVNTVIGEPIDAGNGTTIIPVSKVCLGFAAGGCEFNSGTLDQYIKEGVDEDISYKLPFGGGSGAGVHLMPMGFLVVSADSVKMLPVNHCSECKCGCVKEEKETNSTKEKINNDEDTNN